MSFQNKVVIVTGSSSGIGAATAKLFAKDGADVVITGRNEEKLANVASEITKIGKTPLVIRADVSKENEAKKIIDETVAKFGKIDVLVNNAGFSGWASILGGNILPVFDVIMTTNVRAVVHLTSLAAPHLIKSKGNIVNVSSATSETTPHSAEVISYTVSKAALTHFSKGSALELSKYGVRVNIVSPGPVATDFPKNSGLHYKPQDFAPRMPLKRVSEPEEIGELILYLASDKSKGITGSNFVSDDGFLLIN